VPVRLLYSARSLPEVIYREERTGIAPGGAVDIRYALTRSSRRNGADIGAGSTESSSRRSPGRPGERALVYVCGPTAVVETAASTLVALGHEPGRIRTERLGPTGG